MDKKAGERCARRLSDAFWSLLERKPYAQISVADVLAESKVSRGDFYYHYGNLADLARSAVEEEVEKWDDLLSLLSGIGSEEAEAEAERVIYFLRSVSQQNPVKVERLSALISSNSTMGLVKIFQEGLKDCLMASLGMGLSDFSLVQRVLFEGLMGLTTSLIVHMRLLKDMDRGEIKDLAGRLARTISDLKGDFSPASARGASRRALEP